MYKGLSTRLGPSAHFLSDSLYLHLHRHHPQVTDEDVETQDLGEVTEENVVGRSGTSTGRGV